MQGVAPSAVHPEKAFVELHGAQAVSIPAFGTTHPFFHQAPHVCGTGCQRHWGKAQRHCLQGCYCCASKKAKQQTFVGPINIISLCWRLNTNLLHWHLMGEESPGSCHAPVIQHAGIQLREATGVRSMKSGKTHPFFSLSTRKKMVSAWLLWEMGKMHLCMCILVGVFFWFFLKEYWCIFFPHRNILLHCSGADQASPCTCP